MDQTTLEAVGSLLREPPQCSDKAQGLAIARLGQTFPLIRLLIEYPYGFSHFRWPRLYGHAHTNPKRASLLWHTSFASDSRESHMWQSITIHGQEKAGLFCL